MARGHCTIGLGEGVANVDLAAGDIVLPPIKCQGFGQAGQSMFGRGVGEPLLIIRPPWGS